jgi:hypothetical protein
MYRLNRRKRIEDQYLIEDINRRMDRRAQARARQSRDWRSTLRFIALGAIGLTQAVIAIDRLLFDDEGEK